MTINTLLYRVISIARLAQSVERVTLNTSQSASVDERYVSDLKVASSSLALGFLFVLRFF